MTPEQAKALREPFPAEQIGKLPRVSCKDCSNRNCTKHQKQTCKVCGNYISTAHVHLDFVGHAAVTDRLLSVDPGWTWEPIAVADDGGPLIRQSGREAKLWIRMTVCGVTRIAVGTAPADSFEIDKQLISDAIRNGAMRFGVALDLWSKEDLSHDDETPTTPPPASSAPTPPIVQPAAHDETDTGGFETREQWHAEVDLLKRDIGTAKRSQEFQPAQYPYPWRKETIAEIRKVLATPKPKYDPSQFSEEPFV